jgi:sulfur relay (sulfurtransferase) complex TusBCD TusD component (DsrE family)
MSTTNSCIRTDNSSKEQITMDNSIAKKNGRLDSTIFYYKDTVEYETTEQFQKFNFTNYSNLQELNRKEDINE